MVYHYLMSGDGSVVRLVDPAGNVVATYHYCPTGNAAVPDSGPAAAGNPYRHDGLLRDASTDTDWLGALRIDPDSGNATQPQFCLILGGAFGFLCPRTSPAITGQQAQTQPQCPVTDPDATQDYVVGLFVGIRGPETNNTKCHVNAQVESQNYHIYYKDVFYTTGLFGDQYIPLQLTPGAATASVVDLLAPTSYATSKSERRRVEKLRSFIANDLGPRLVRLQEFVNSGS